MLYLPQFIWVTWLVTMATVASLGRTHSWCTRSSQMVISIGSHLLYRSSCLELLQLPHLCHQRVFLDWDLLALWFSFDWFTWYPFWFRIELSLSWSWLVQYVERATLQLAGLISGSSSWLLHAHLWELCSDLCLEDLVWQELFFLDRAWSWRLTRVYVVDDSLFGVREVCYIDGASLSSSIWPASQSVAQLLFFNLSALRLAFEKKTSEGGKCAEWYVNLLYAI